MIDHMLRRMLYMLIHGRDPQAVAKAPLAPLAIPRLDQRPVDTTFPPSGCADDEASFEEQAEYRYTLRALAAHVREVPRSVRLAQLYKKEIQS